MRYPVQYTDYMTEEQGVRDEWWHPAEDDVVLDIGCMMGNWALPALEAGARVIAVDPNKGDTAVLSNIAWQNNWHRKLTIMNCAFFDGGEYPQDYKDAMAASKYAHLQPPAGTELRTVDSLELARLNWVKIDVEGAEYGILQGMTETLKRCHPKLVIEDHSIPYQWVRDNDITGKCSRLLEDFGYSVIQWNFDENRMFLVAA